MRAERAERQGELQRVAEIRYGELPALEQELAERASDGAEPMVKEEVDEDNAVAAVVARWTGIPVTRLLEGETEKLIHMEERLHRRVVGQARQSRPSTTRSAARAPGCRPTGRSARSCSSARPASARPSWRAPGRVHVRRRARDGAASTCPSTRSGTGSPGSSARRPAMSATRKAAGFTEAVRRRRDARRRPPRRDREGAFRGLRRASADPRRRPPHRRPGPHGRLPQRRRDRDAEPPLPEEELQDRFRPEFLNRIDEIVRFEPLTRDQIGEIVDLQLARLATRLADQGLSLELTDEAKEHLAEAGWDPAYGARPLKRAISAWSRTRSHCGCSSGEGDTVRVDVRDGELVFDRAPSAAPAAV